MSGGARAGDPGGDSEPNNNKGGDEFTILDGWTEVRPRRRNQRAEVLGTYSAAFPAPAEVSAISVTPVTRGDEDQVPVLISFETEPARALVTHLSALMDTAARRAEIALSSDCALARASVGC